MAQSSTSAGEPHGASPAATATTPPVKVRPKAPLDTALWDAALEQARMLGAPPIFVNGIDGRSLDLDPVRSHVTTIQLPPDALKRLEGAQSHNYVNYVNEPLLIFPGSLEELKAAIAAKLVPACSAALVLKDEAWHHVNIGPDSTTASPAAEPWRGRSLRNPVASMVARRMPGLAQRLHANLHVRRLQPLIDSSERDLISAIAKSFNFPFRIASVVDRRVLLGIGQLGPGGAERQLINTAEGLKRRGFNDVHLLLVHAREQDRFYLDKAGLSVSSLRVCGGRDFTKHPWLKSNPKWRRHLSDYLINCIFNAAQHICELRPSVVQVSLDWSNVIFGMAAVLCGVPHIFVSGRNLAPHHFEFFQWFMYPCYRALLAQPNVVMTNNSEAGRDSYARWLRIKPDRIRVIRNGLARDEFAAAGQKERVRIRRELGITDTAPIVMGAFRLSAEKRPLLWLETAAEIRKTLPDARFILCGVGNMEEQVKARAGALDLTDSLKMLGARKDIAAIFSAADLVLQTSLQEGTPNTLIEAQAMGKPVVTTTAYGAAEAVAHGQTGFVVKRAKATELANASLKILRDANFQARVREEGPRWVEERFGFERMIDDTLIAYADAGVPWAAEVLPESKRYQAVVPIENMVAEQGYCWRAYCPQLKALADGMHHPHRSPLRLREDGRWLGPPHAPHDEIRSDGGGRFLHWGAALYFSTSDNTSPLENGRRYELVIPRGPHLAKVRR